MITSFRHKGLKELFEAGKTARIAKQMHKRIMERLDALDAAEAPAAMNVPGYDFHALRGFRPTRYSIHVNGPWCITFEFEGENAVRVDYEQYH
jgi:toxin HigB-1